MPRASIPERCIACSRGAWHALEAHSVPARLIKKRNHPDGIYVSVNNGDLHERSTAPCAVHGTMFDTLHQVRYTAPHMVQSTMCGALVHAQITAP